MIASHYKNPISLCGLGLFSSNNVYSCILKQWIVFFAISSVIHLRATLTCPFNSALSTSPCISFLPNQPRLEPIQCGICTGIEVLESAAIFDMDIRIRTWLGAAKAVISHCIQISVIYTLLSQSQRLFNILKNNQPGPGLKIKTLQFLFLQCFSKQIRTAYYED